MSLPALVAVAIAAGTEVRVLRVTAYCDRGVTASGVRAGPGQCAAPAWVPFGARIYVPRLRRAFVVTDRTHPRFRHNTVDVWQPRRAACRRIGVSWQRVTIVAARTP